MFEKTQNKTETSVNSEDNREKKGSARGIPSQSIFKHGLDMKSCQNSVVLFQFFHKIRQFYFLFHNFNLTHKHFYFITMQFHSYFD